MKCSLGVGAVGMVRIEKWSKSRGKEVFEFPNVILRSGFETYIDRSLDDLNASSGNSCFLGTGTMAPTLEDSGLEQVDASTGRYLTSASPLSGWHQTDDYFVSSIQFRYDWGEGEAEGTWTELGLAFWDLVGSSAWERGNSNTYTYPFSRALIRGSDGSPISLTVLPDEYLRVFYTVIAYIDRSIGNSSVSFDGSPVLLSDKLFVENAYRITSSNWRRFFHHRLPLLGCSLLVVPGQGSQSGRVTRTPDHEGRSVLFTFSDPPGVFCRYNRIVIGDTWSSSNRTTISRITWEFESVVDKPIEKNISGTATVSIKAKHWKILLLGKVSSATNTTLTMAGANWTTDQFAGMVAGIVAGDGWQSMSTIVSNTADTLTVSPNWHENPTEGSLFEIREYDYE